VKTKKEIIYAKECYQIIGIIFEVFNELGYGHKEKFYQKAIANSFLDKSIEFKEQLQCKFKYKGKDLGIYVLDFLVFNKIVLELKQKKYFSSQDIKQLYMYLKAMKLKLGLLVTFTGNGIKFKRILNLY
jgi:GxxExxY protein